MLTTMGVTASAAEYTSGLYTYTLSGNQATITKVDDSISGAVTLPSSIMGYTVVGIGQSVFENHNSIKSVTIPNSITDIGYYAFKGCNSLTSVTIGNGLTTIPYYGFQGCTSLETLKIGANVTQIDSYAFASCTALNNITWGSSLKNIGDSAFSGCTALTTVSIPNTVTTIGDAAFYDCSSITSLAIGSKVTTIGNSAFYGCSSLKSVVIPEKVTTIGNYAFEYCTGLKKVYFPENLQTISYYAFSGCLNITDVYYAGDESDWKYVSIESGNDPLTNSTVTYHYNYGVDVTNPTGSISSTNNVSTSQTVTLTLSDNVGVAGYYWGTSSIYGNNTYTSTSSTRIDKTILTSGTYYLTVKDTSGNLSATYSITFYKTTLNANGGTVSPSYVITKGGNSITLPIPTQSGANFVGWGVSASSTSGVKSITPVENKTYYAIWEKIPATVSSISIQSKPTKTVYTVGEKFDASGLKVKVTMSDGTTKTITSGFTLSNPDMSTAGTKTVTVTYSGKTTSFTITVKAAEPSANTGALRLITPASARVGQRVQIPVQLDKASLGTLTFTVKYDHTKLKYVSCTESSFDMCDVYAGNTGVIRAACIDNAAVSAGRMAVLTFEVIAPSACLTDLTLTVEEAYDGSDKAVSVTAAYGIYLL